MHDPRRALLAVALLLSGCGAVHDPGQAPLRRLTPWEYNRTIADLFGYDDADAWPILDGDDEEEAAAPWPSSLPPDVAIHGFEGMVEGQVSSPYLTERYQAVALHYARHAPAAPFFWTCAAPGKPLEDKNGGRTATKNGISKNKWEQQRQDYVRSTAVLIGT